MQTPGQLAKVRNPAIRFRFMAWKTVLVARRAMAGYFAGTAARTAAGNGS